MTFKADNPQLPDCEHCGKPRIISYIKNVARISILINVDNNRKMVMIPWAFTKIDQCKCQKDNFIIPQPKSEKPQSTEKGRESQMET